MLLPGLSATSSRLVVAMTFSETTGLLASGCETTRFAVLVDWVDDPVDAGITTDGFVLRVNEDDLVVLVGRVLVDPVGVEDAEVGTSLSDTLFSGGTERSLVLELVDTLVGWLACVTACQCMLPHVQLSMCTYRRWHPLAMVAFAHHDELGCGR